MTVEQHWQPTGRSRDESWIQFTRRRWLNYWRRWRWGGDVVMGTGLIGMGKFDRDELGWHGKNHGDGVGIGTIYFTVSLSCSHQMPFFSYRIHQIQFWLGLDPPKTSLLGRDPGCAVLKISLKSPALKVPNHQCLEPLLLLRNTILDSYIFSRELGRGSRLAIEETIDLTRCVLLRRGRNFTGRCLRHQPPQPACEHTRTH